MKVDNYSVILLGVLLIYVILFVIMFRETVMNYKKNVKNAYDGLVPKQVDLLNRLKKANYGRYQRLLEFYRLRRGDTRRGRVLDLKGGVVDEGLEICKETMK